MLRTTRVELFLDDNTMVFKKARQEGDRLFVKHEGKDLEFTIKTKPIHRAIKTKLLLPTMASIYYCKYGSQYTLIIEKATESALNPRTTAEIMKLEMMSKLSRDADFKSMMLIFILVGAIAGIGVGAAGGLMYMQDKLDKTTASIIKPTIGNTQLNGSVAKPVNTTAPFSGG